MLTTGISGDIGNGAPRQPGPEEAAGGHPKEDASHCVIVCPSDVDKVHALPEGATSVLRIFHDDTDSVARFAQRMGIPTVVDPIIDMAIINQVFQHCLKLMSDYLVVQPDWADCSTEMRMLLRWVATSSSKMNINPLVYLAKEVAAIAAFGDMPMSWIVPVASFRSNRHLNAIFYGLVELFLTKDPYQIFDVYQCDEGADRCDMATLRGQHRADLEHILKTVPKKMSKLGGQVTVAADLEKVCKDFLRHLGLGCAPEIMCDLHFIGLVAALRQEKPDQRAGCADALAAFVKDHQLSARFTIKQWFDLGLSYMQLVEMGFDKAAVVDYCLPLLLGQVVVTEGCLVAPTGDQIKVFVEKLAVKKSPEEWMALIAPLRLSDDARVELYKVIGFSESDILFMDTQHSIQVQLARLRRLAQSIHPDSPLVVPEEAVGRVSAIGTFGCRNRGANHCGAETAERVTSPTVVVVGGASNGGPA